MFDIKPAWLPWTNKLQLTQAFFTYIPVAYEYVGCYKDTATRAMPVALPRRIPLIDCKNEAAFRGYTVFGIQNGIECWSGPNAPNTYNKYGISTACKNGEGGPWANDVYRITSGKLN
jgi:hypothetical protein